MRTILLVAVFGLLASAAAVGADEVHLTNGKAFEDVTARVVGDSVAIGLPGGGEIRLPMSQVEKIERGVTATAVFEDKARELSADPRSSAGEWMVLADWARTRGLGRAYRQAALEAARRDPELPAAQAAMRELGYVFEEQADQWLPRTEALLRRGLVPYGGEWMTAEEREHRIRAEDERARQRAQDERLDRLARLVEIQAEMELARGLAEAARPDPPPAYYPPSYPIWFVPGFFPKQPHHHHRPPHRHDPPPPSVPPRHHRGGHDYVTPVDFTDFIPGRLNPDAAPPPGQLGVRLRSR